VPPDGVAPDIDVLAPTSSYVARHRVRRPPRRRRLVLLLPLGVLACFVAAFGAAVGWQAWQVHQSGEAARAVQAELLAELDATAAADAVGTSAAGSPVVVRRDAVRAGARPVEWGRPLAVVEIPALGEDWRWALLEGTEDEVIANGLGHYAWTPLPGEPGNVAIAGHRAGYGSPFLDFDRLAPGDEVRIEQAGTAWTYVVDTEPRVIGVDDVHVLDPLPGHRLTLTTCWPKYGSSHRMVVRATLAARGPA